MSRCIMDHVAPRSRDRLNDGFRRVLSASALVKSESTPQDLILEGTTFEDWWVARVKGNGSFGIHGELPRGAMKDWAMLTLVLSGEFHTVGSQEYFGRPGEVSLKRWVSFDNVQIAGNFSYQTIYLPVAHLERLSVGEVPYNKTLSTHSGAGGFVGSVMRSWGDAVLGDREPEAICSVSDNFLRLVLDAMSTAETTNSQCAPASSRRVDRVLDHLKANLGHREITPASTARQCGLSERQLYRDFAERGERFSTALRKLRLEEAAARLLWNRDDPITTIALDCGFASSAHFARLFRDDYGQSPSDYRNNHIRQ